MGNILKILFFWLLIKIIVKWLINLFFSKKLLVLCKSVKFFVNRIVFWFWWVIFKVVDKVLFILFVFWLKNGLIWELLGI